MSKFSDRLQINAKLSWPREKYNFALKLIYALVVFSVKRYDKETCSRLLWKLLIPNSHNVTQDVDTCLIVKTISFLKMPIQLHIGSVLLDQPHEQQTPSVNDGLAGLYKCDSEFDPMSLADGGCVGRSQSYRGRWI